MLEEILKLLLERERSLEELETYLQVKRNKLYKILKEAVSLGYIETANDVYIARDTLKHYDTSKIALILKGKYKLFYEDDIFRKILNRLREQGYIRLSECSSMVGNETICLVILSRLKKEGLVYRIVYRLTPLGRKILEEG